MTTNYINTFVAIAPDSIATAGTELKPGTQAAAHLRLLRDDPYGLTSDEMLFLALVERTGIDEADRERAWQAFQAKPMACLRASALVKTLGWGLHHDARGKVAAYGVETDDYRRLAAEPGLKQTKGMRSKRG